MRSPTRRLVLAAMFVLDAITSAAAQPERSGRELFIANCASCHGGDGRGLAAREARYPVPPPDLTDCQFTNREASADWLAVTHYGGPARGFDRAMPAFGEVMNERERESVVTYVRTLCRDASWPRGELNLPLAFLTEKAFPEDEAIVSVAAAHDDVTTLLVYERRFAARWQIEVAAPIVYAKQPDGSWAGGVGDIGLAVKRVLAASLAHGSIASLGLEVVTPSGRVDRGFGGGTLRFEPFLLFGQILPAGLFLQGQLGGSIAYDRDFPDEVSAHGVLGDQVIPVRGGRMFSPMVEVVALRELDTGARTDVDVVPQMQITLSARQHIRASFGVQVPVTDREGRATVGLAYILWDWFDGPLTGGW